MNRLYVTNREEWRLWLEKNHGKEKEVWLVFYKKHTGKPIIPYDDSVEEALCFGWIDSIIKRIDDEKFARKFTPRKDCSKWSELNKKRAKKMLRDGRMTEAGLVKINVSLDGENKETKRIPAKGKPVIPDDIAAALRVNKKAWENFKNFAPGYQRLYIGWITSAKREETRKKRLKEALDLIAKNKKSLMK